MGLFHDNDRLSIAQVPTGQAQATAERALHDLRPIDLRDAWKFAEAQAGVALRTWFSAPRDEKADAYAAYRAAVDREDAAATMLESRLALAADGSA
jgi:hypothetical protein